MTGHDLERAIQSGEASRCRTLLKNIPEADRRAVAQVAMMWHTAVTSRRTKTPRFLELSIGATPEEQLRVGAAASVAMMGTATLAEMKRMGWAAFSVADEAFAALSDRNPPWLAEWADWALGADPRSWAHVRRMVREGLIPRPAVEAYVTAMIGSLQTRDPLTLLREDPGLLEHEVWRLFEVEGGGEDSLAARDKFQHVDRSWSAALRVLAGEGRLDRRRLLTASLEALQRDFAQFRAGWFSRFHEEMQPALEERVEWLDDYLALLGSPIPPTVSFALKALTLIDKAGRLPYDRFLDAVPPALDAREKGTVMQALKLIERAMRQDASLPAAGLRVVPAALIHESSEVQGRVLDLIERYGDRDDATLKAALAELRPAVSPTHRARLEQWLGGSAGVPEEPAGGVAGDGWLAEVTSLPADLSELAGVDAASVLVRDGSLMLPPLDLRDLRIPRLDPASRLLPVEDLDELIELFSQVLENEGPPEDMERVLDGVSRLCAERPPDWEARVSPLRRRANALGSRGRNSLRDDLCRLAAAWLSGEVLEPTWSQVYDVLSFHASRVLALSVRAAYRQSGPLLAAPTHAGGWLAPGALVERVRALQSLPPVQFPALSPAVREVLGASAAEHGCYDAVQALLRLAPDGRREALAAASDLSGELGAAVRYALGGDGIEIGPTAALWVAAARARQPWGDLPALEARHPGLGPGAAVGVHARIEFREDEEDDDDEDYDIEDEFCVTRYLHTEPPISMSASLAMPTVLQLVELRRGRLHYRAPVDERWCATVWPLNREAECAACAYLMLNNIDWVEAEWANAVRLKVLLDPDTHLGCMARQLLLFGLAAKEPTESGLAIDIAIAAIADGRLTAPSLGETLCQTLPMHGVKGARLAKTLREVARSSTLHALTVKFAVERGMAAAACQRPADLGALLELLQELCIQTGTALTEDAARSALQSLPGSGKAVKLAKAVLALAAAGKAADQLADAGAAAVAGRVNRAMRWASWRLG